MVDSTHYTGDGGGNYSDKHWEDKQKIFWHHLEKVMFLSPKREK